jgi:hypothetical protein
VDSRNGWSLSGLCNPPAAGRLCPSLQGFINQFPDMNKFLDADTSSAACEW